LAVGAQHCNIFTESQNDRMVGAGRDLCGSSSPTPLPKQGRLQQAYDGFKQHLAFSEQRVDWHQAMNVC